MMETITHKIFLLTNPTTDTWTDISADVLLRESTWTHGIPSTSPTVRVASVGYARLMLRNDTYGGRAGNRFSPGHANCITGFEVGAKIEIKSYWRDFAFTRWVGWIAPQGIQESTSPELKIVMIMAYDWMYFALNNKVTLQEIGIDKTLGEIATDLAGLIEAQPSKIELSTYSETFANTNDTVRENTTVMGELDKAVMSEMGYAYIKYGQTTDKDILMIEGREHRDTVPLFYYYPLLDSEKDYLTDEDGNHLTDESGNRILISSRGEFVDGIPSMLMPKILHGANYANKVIGKAYPREVGATSVIFTLNEPIRIDAGEIIENLRISYVVKEGYVDVAARDVSITDYAMNSLENGTGVDLTTDLTITPEFGSADARLTLENTGAADAYITVLELSGDPIYIADTVEQFIEVPSVSDKYYGKIEMLLDQKYQTVPARTLDQITLLVVRYSTKTNSIESFTICASKNAASAAIYMMCDVGSKIPLASTDFGINEPYFIQGVEVRMEGNATFVTYTVKPARYDTYIFWLLGESGYSELGDTTILGIED